MINQAGEAEARVAEWYSDGPLNIDAAWYGDVDDVWAAGSGAPVTEQVRRLVADGELRLNPDFEDNWRARGPWKSAPPVGLADVTLAAIVRMARRATPHRLVGPPGRTSPRELMSARTLSPGTMSASATPRPACTRSWRCGTGWARRAHARWSACGPAGLKRPLPGVRTAPHAPAWWLGGFGPWEHASRAQGDGLSAFHPTAGRRARRRAS